MGNKLEQYYIFPAIAEKCSEYLQLQLKKGAYEKFSDPKTFADAVTNDLREVSKDKHMTFDLLEELSVKQIEKTKKIIYSTPDLVESDEYKSYEYKSDHFEEFSYEVKSGRLENDPTIGYLDLRTMGICKTGDKDSYEVKKDGDERRTAFIKAVEKLKGTKSIIIDLRNNGGGKPNAVQLLCSLFMEEKSHLDGIEWRKGDFYQIDAWDTLPYEDLPKETRLLEQKVVILISPNTFSAAESCANSMRASKKGTMIVGERSGGGVANPGGYEPIGKYFDIRIPSGRAINPHQEGNWEGIGIIPDHEVSAKDALNMAISL
ncbi:MAG TPA: S41 family peptidase [Parachlamydiaceae bacterium]|nr:S41 family peptidase [Parachlamydiaceae bacterium]